MAPKPKNRAHMDAEAVARMMAAAEREDDPVSVPAPAPTPEPPAEIAPVLERPSAPPAPLFDPGKVDGRTLRKTFREPFATRIKPETHHALRRLAVAQGISIAEAVERAVAAYSKTAS